MSLLYMPKVFYPLLNNFASLPFSRESVQRSVALNLHTPYTYLSRSPPLPLPIYTLPFPIYATHVPGLVASNSAASYTEFGPVVFLALSNLDSDASYCHICEICMSLACVNFLVLYMWNKSHTHRNASYMCLVEISLTHIYT